MVEGPGIFMQYAEAVTKSHSVSRGEDMDPIIGHTVERTYEMDICCGHHWETTFTTMVLTPYSTFQKILLTSVIIKQQTIR